MKNTTAGGGYPPITTTAGAYIVYAVGLEAATDDVDAVWTITEEKKERVENGI